MSANAQVFADRLARLATESLIAEADLTPKPGLVDRRGSGAHKDLSLSLMKVSAQTLKSSFEAMALQSWQKPLDLQLRESIGRIGRDGEAEMLEATGGANTHRGAIWTLGILTSASAAIGKMCSEEELSDACAHLATLPDRYCLHTPSHGSKVKAVYKVPGAREEAQKGFPHVMTVAIPALRKARSKGKAEDYCRLDALLTLMSTLTDTCVLYRAGWDGLRLMQNGARAVLDAGGMGTQRGDEIYFAWEKKMIENNISPGGAADLLAAAIFVDRLATVFKEVSEN